MLQPVQQLTAVCLLGFAVHICLLNCSVDITRLAGIHCFHLEAVQNKPFYFIYLFFLI